MSRSSLTHCLLYLTHNYHNIFFDVETGDGVRVETHSECVKVGKPGLSISLMLGLLVLVHACLVTAVDLCHRVFPLGDDQWRGLLRKTPVSNQ